MSEVTLVDRFRGALLGTALGDAVGAGFEASFATDEKRINQKIIRASLLKYTDDAAMAIGIAESLVACGGFNVEHMVEQFVANWEREPWRGYAGGPPKIFRRVRQGTPWETAAAEMYQGGSYGNGAAMRAMPVGLFFRDEHGDAFRGHSDAIARITHAHPLGKEGAALIAFAVSMATREKTGESLDPRAFWGEMRAFVREPMYQEKLDHIAKLLPKPDQHAFITQLGNSVEAHQSAPTALACFLAHPQDFQKAILFAVSLGGDADTIAAMAGGISGAYLEAEGLPQEWLAKLENHDYIDRLAKDLYQVYREKPVSRQ